MKRIKISLSRFGAFKSMSMTIFAIFQTLLISVIVKGNKEITELIHVNGRKKVTTDNE